MPRIWNDDLLESLRSEADPLADGIVAAYFANLEGLEGTDQSGLFRHLVTHDHGPPEVVDYLNQPLELPSWADTALMAEGQERFARWGSHVFTALYAAALPSAYACWRGVQVLGLTARLVTDPKRRLNETAQFHLDVMTPGGLSPGSQGIDDIRHVRLMHAAVRWLIDHDPRGCWDPTWGVPINQEDLLETLLTFTEIVFEVFDRTGIEYGAADADAYLHTWSVIGYLLGVKTELLPLSRADTSTLMPVVRRRQFATSDAGRLLTAALLEQGRSLAPPGLRGLPATTIRYYVGDATGDLLGLPPANWTRVMFGPLAAVTRLLSAERAHRRLLRGMSDRIGFGMLELAVRAERAGSRPAFGIPDELADRWGVTVTATRPGRGPSATSSAARPKTEA